MKPSPDCHIYQEVINCPLRGPIHVVQGGIPLPRFWSPWIAIRYPLRSPGAHAQASPGAPTIVSDYRGAGLGVGAAVGFLVAVGVGLRVAVGVGLRVAVGVGFRVAVGVGLRVGV